MQFGNEEKNWTDHFIAAPLSSPSHRNSSSRERGDNFERSNRSERFDRGEDRRDDHDRNRLLVTKRSFSREKEERSREREQRGPADPVRRVASMTDDRDRARSREKNGGGGGRALGTVGGFSLHVLVSS